MYLISFFFSNYNTVTYSSATKACALVKMPRKPWAWIPTRLCEFKALTILFSKSRSCSEAFMSDLAPSAHADVNSNPTSHTSCSHHRESWISTSHQRLWISTFIWDSVACWISKAEVRVQSSTWFELQISEMFFYLSSWKSMNHHMIFETRTQDLEKEIKEKHLSIGKLRHEGMNIYWYYCFHIYKSHSFFYLAVTS